MIFEETLNFVMRLVQPFIWCVRLSVGTAGTSIARKQYLLDRRWSIVAKDLLESLAS